MRKDSNRDSLVFARSINPVLENGLISAIKEKKPPEYKNPDFEIQRRNLTNDEKQIINTIGNETFESLREMGVEVERLTESIPINIDSVLVYEFLSDKPLPVSGHFDWSEKAVIIFVPKGHDLSTAEFRRVLIHELSHITTKTTLIRDITNPNKSVPRISSQNLGFDNVSSLPNQENHTRGVFSEAMAEMLTYKVLGKSGDTLSSPYEQVLPFMFAFIKDFSKKTHQSEKQVFHTFYSSHAHRRISFFKELVTYYSTNFVRKLNTVKFIKSNLEDKNAIRELADAGGFLTELEVIEKDFKNDQGLVLEGVAGKVVYQPQLT